MKSFVRSDLTTAAVNPLDRQADLDREQSVRRHYQSREVAVYVPLLQSIIPGVIVGILIATILYSAKASPQIYLIGGFLAFLFITLLIYILLVSNWQRLIWSMEHRWSQQYIPQASQAAPPNIRAEVKRGNQLNFYELKGDQRQLLKLWTTILAGGEITQKKWTPLENGFSRPRFEQAVNDLVSAGVLAWKDDANHDLGVIRTAEAQQILSQWIADLTHGRPTPGQRLS